MNTSVAEREIKLEVLSKVINKWSTVTILSTRTDRPGANSVDPDLQFNTHPFVFWTHQQVKWICSNFRTRMVRRTLSVW